MVCMFPPYDTAALQKCLRAWADSIPRSVNAFFTTPSYSTQHAFRRSRASLPRSVRRKLPMTVSLAPHDRAIRERGFLRPLCTAMRREYASGYHDTLWVACRGYVVPDARFVRSLLQQPNRFAWKHHDNALFVWDQRSVPIHLQLPFQVRRIGEQFIPTTRTLRDTGVALEQAFHSTGTDVRILDKPSIRDEDTAPLYEKPYDVNLLWAPDWSQIAGSSGCVDGDLACEDERRADQMRDWHLVSASFTAFSLCGIAAIYFASKHRAFKSWLS